MMTSAKNMRSCDYMIIVSAVYIYKYTNIQIYINENRHKISFIFIKNIYALNLIELIFKCSGHTALQISEDIKIAII